MGYLCHSVTITQEPALGIHDLRDRNVFSESGIHENIIDTGLPSGVEHMLSMILIKSMIQVFLLPSPPEAVELHMMNKEHRV